MLAGIRDYLFIEWQLPIIGAFLIIWMLGSGWILKKSVAKCNNVERKTMGRCVLASLLSGIAAFICGVIGGYITDTIFKACEIQMLPVTIAAAIVCALAVMFIVMHAMFDLPAKKTISVMSLPLLFTVVFGVATAAAVGLPAYYIHMDQARRETSIKKLWQIRSAILEKDGYCERFSKPPESLENLVEHKMVDRNTLSSPFMPEGQVGYFYLPSQITQKKEIQPNDNRILACDLHYVKVRGQEGRCAAMMSNACLWLPKDEFEKYLAMPENEEFAKALQSAQNHTDKK